jgi:hypothetical protein
MDLVPEVKIIVHREGEAVEAEAAPAKEAQAQQTPEEAPAPETEPAEA